jgi:excisionase family DNA binding protein
MTTTARPHRPDPGPRLLNISEVAAHLGVDIRHVRRLVHERRIPYIKWGHLLRFDPDELATWIDTHRRHPGRPGS